VVVVGHGKGNFSLGMPRTDTERKEVQFHSFLISALDRASGQLHNLAPLPPGKDPMVPEEAGWTPKLILMF